MCAQRAAEIVEQQVNNGDGGLSEQWLTDLQEDNAQLRMTLSKFQSAIDLIMAKHRSQVRMDSIVDIALHCSAIVKS